MNHAARIIPFTPAIVSEESESGSAIVRRCKEGSVTEAKCKIVQYMLESALQTARRLGVDVRLKVNKDWISVDREALRITPTDRS